MAEQDHCAIRRIAVLHRYDGDTAVIEVEGKYIHIPAVKISPDAAEGAALAWKNGLWRPHEPDSSGGNQKPAG